MKCVRGHEIEVLSSICGFYIGTMSADEELDGAMSPNCRISDYMSKEEATEALTNLKPYHIRMSAEINYCNGGVSCI